MIVNKPVLICGSGPSLPEQLSRVDLSNFYVVRVNPWREIDGQDNKCDAWAFYPHSKIDFRSYLSKTKHLWMPHFGMAGECARVTGRPPDYTISEQQTIDFHFAVGHGNPTSGAVAIYMALLLGAPVYIAGFDFYKGDNTYYWRNEPAQLSGINHHKPHMEEFWVNKQIENGKLFKLGAK